MAAPLNVLTCRGVVPIVLALLLISSLSGCQTFQGSTVPVQYRTALEDSGEGSGKWQTSDLNLNYQYTRQDGLLKVSGNVLLRRSSVDRFHLDMFLLDSEGRVIGSVGVLSVSSGGNSTFQAERSIPAATKAIAFGYTGQATVHEQGSISFWEYPF